MMEGEGKRDGEGLWTSAMSFVWGEDCLGMVVGNSASALNSLLSRDNNTFLPSFSGHAQRQ